MMVEMTSKPDSGIPINTNLLDSSAEGYRASRTLSTSSNSNSYSGSSYITNYLPVNSTDVFEAYVVRANTGIHFYDENKTFLSAVSSGGNNGTRYLYASGLSTLTPRIAIPSNAAFVRLSLDGKSISSSHYYKRIK